MGNMQLELISCPICGNRSCDKILDDCACTDNAEIIITLVRCNTCGLAYVNPCPVRKDILLFYPNNYDAYARTASDARTLKLLPRVISYNIYNFLRKFSFSKIIWKNIISRIRANGEIDLRLVKLNEKSHILDIGCGTGLFLNHIRWLTGCFVKGVEPNENARQKANGLLGEGVVENSFLDKFNDKGYFDCVTMWHVLEHLPEPLGVLRKISTILNDSGWLIISAPNIDSWNWSIFGRNWLGIDLPRHLQFFSPKTAQALLEKGGFKTEKIIYRCSAANFLGSLQKVLWGNKIGTCNNCHIPDLQGNIFLKFFIMPFCFLSVLFHKSDGIVIYARKLQGQFKIMEVI